MIVTHTEQVYRALAALFEEQTFNVRREVLVDMVCSGSANLSFQQV
jgi:hypothetical protein